MSAADKDRVPVFTYREVEGFIVRWAMLGWLIGMVMTGLILFLVPGGLCAQTLRPPVIVADTVAGATHCGGASIPCSGAKSAPPAGR